MYRITDLVYKIFDYVSIMQSMEIELSFGRCRKGEEEVR
jgi:hypothetical protein